MAKETKKTRAAAVAEVRPHALLRQARERLASLAMDPREHERLSRVLYALGCLLSLPRFDPGSEDQRLADRIADRAKRRAALERKRGGAKALGKQKSAEAELLDGLDKSARAYLRKIGLSPAATLVVSDRSTFVRALVAQAEAEIVPEGETHGGMLSLLLGLYGRPIFGSGDRAKAEAAADAARELDRDAEGVVVALLKAYTGKRADGIVRAAMGYSK